MKIAMPDLLRPRYTALLLVLSALFAGGYFLLYFQYDRTWETMLGDCPLDVTTGGVISNGKLYILKQTHEPLFRLDDGQNYTSKVLTSWSRSLDSRVYVFCPDTSLKFDASHAFTADFFGNHIREAVRKFDPRARVSASSGCFKVEFEKSQGSFLDFLSDYPQAPSIIVSSNVAVGLGEYYVKSLASNQIVLLRKRPRYRGYNKVIAHRYLGATDPMLQNRNITDFNKISSAFIPAWAKSSYVRFNDAVLSSVFVIINHPDKEIRDAVYNCMDVTSLRMAFMPELGITYDIQNVLPIGMPGAVPGKARQICSVPKKLHGKLLFADLRTGNEASLRAFMRSFQERTGIKVEVVNWISPKFAAALSKKPKQYNLVIISANASGWDTGFYLDYFDWLDYELPEIKRAYSEMSKASDPLLKNELSRKVVEGYSKERVILPLYQAAREYYYPRDIKNLMIGRSFMEFPVIGDYRW